MSDTESFEYALWKAIDDCKIDENADTITGSYIKSLRNQDRVVAAHIREIRNTAQREYHRGYVDAMHARATATWQLGQERMEAVRKLMEYDVDNDTYDTFARAIGVGQDECIRTRLIHLLGGDSNLQKSPNPINKDAEPPSYFIENAEFNKLNDREKVVRKLQALQFGGGSHENLSGIAYAVYPCATGWTRESAAGLRDKLVELMGGVSKPSFADQAKDIMNTIIEEGNKRLQNDGREMQDETEDEIGTANDSRIDTDCGDCGRDFHVDGVISYDEMDAEPTSDQSHESSLMRQENETCITDELREWASTEVPYKYGRQLHAIADRIDARHYLTSAVADASTSDAWIAMNEYDKLRRQRDELRAELDELRGHSRTCPKSGDEVSESALSVSITDELRECVDTATKTYDDTPWYGMDEGEEADHTTCHITEGELMRIADRIDAQFDRICQQQEAVLQSTIDDIVGERGEGHNLFMPVDVFLRERDKLRHDVEMWRDRAEDMRMERDELQAKLDELEKFDADTSLAAFGDDNDELRRLLSRAAKLLANAEQDRDANYAYWMDCKEKVVHANATIEELQAKLDGYERHDTAESIVRELTLGSITEEQAITRIESLRGAK